MTISDYSRNRIVSLYLQGVTRDEIASRISEGSEGTVSNVIKDFEENVGTEYAKALREFSKLFTKNHLPPGAAVKGYTVANIGFELGFQGDDYEKQMRTLGVLLKKGGAKPVAQALTVIDSVLAKNPSISLENLPGEVEGLAKSFADLTNRRDGLVTEIASLKNSLEERRKADEAEIKCMLDANELTKNDLEEYKQDKAALAARGLDIRNIHDFERTMKECDETDYKSDRVIEKCKDNDSLEDQNAKLQQEVEQYQKKKNELVSSIQELEPMLRVHQKSLEQLAILERIGLQEEELVKIVEVLTQVSFDLGSERKYVVRKAMDDFLKIYRDGVYFQEWVKNLEARVQGLKREAEGLQNTIADDKKKHQDERELKQEVVETEDKIKQIGTSWVLILREAMRYKYQDKPATTFTVQHYEAESVARFFKDTEAALIKWAPLVLARVGVKVPINDVLEAFLQEFGMVDDLLEGKPLQSEFRKLYHGFVALRKGPERT